MVSKPSGKVTERNDDTFSKAAVSMSVVPSRMEKEVRLLQS